MKARTKNGELVEVEEVVFEGRTFAIRLGGASYVLAESRYSAREVELRFVRGGVLDALLAEREVIDAAIREAGMVEGTVAPPPPLPPRRR